MPIKTNSGAVRTAPLRAVPEVDEAEEAAGCGVIGDSDLISTSSKAGCQAIDEKGRKREAKT